MKRRERPRVGAHVTYRSDGTIHHGTVQYYPTTHGDGQSFPVRDDAPPNATIQSWPDDPRIIEIVDGEDA
jgi:hypothetical protein